jgi:hypothetical protein
MKVIWSLFYVSEQWVKADSAIFLQCPEQRSDGATDAARRREGERGEVTGASKPKVAPTKRQPRSRAR